MSSGGGGVRNLRAMFENKADDNALPDRTGSPAGRSGTPPVPLNKVRTSFIAVERNGQYGPQLGLRRDTSGSESSMPDLRGISTERRESSLSRQVSAGSTISLDLKPKISNPPIPEAAEQQKQQDTKAEESRGRKVDPAPTTSALASTAAASKVDEKPKPEEQPKVEEKPKSGKTTPTTGVGAKKTATAGKTTTGAQKPAATAVSATKPTTTKVAAGKTTPVQKTTAKPATKLAVPESKAPTRKPSHTTLNAAAKKTAPAASTTTTATKKPAPVLTQGTKSSTGFVKPKPKSPTRPARLPASMTAPTASSISKTSATTPPRQSAGSSTRAPLPKTTVDPSKPRRAASTKERPSLGRPTVANERPKSRVSTAAPDDSFLARMMRPTAASAGKTQEKATTPPRKAPVRRSSRTSTGTGRATPSVRSPRASVSPRGKTTAAEPPKMIIHPPTVVAEEPQEVEEPATLTESPAASVVAEEAHEEIEKEVEVPEVVEEAAAEKETEAEPVATAEDQVDSAKRESVVDEPVSAEPIVEQPATEEPIEEPHVERVEEREEPLEAKTGPSVETLPIADPTVVTEASEIPDGSAVEELHDEKDPAADAVLPEPDSFELASTTEEPEADGDNQAIDVLTESMGKLNVVAPGAQKVQQLE